MLFLGPVSTVFDILTFAFLLNVTGWNTAAHAPMFHSAWFLVGIFTQQAVLHVLRTERVPFFKSTASWKMYASSAAVIVASLLFTLTPINVYFKMEIPAKEFWVFLPVTVVAYCALAELAKIAYKSVFNSWI